MIKKGFTGGVKTSPPFFSTKAQTPSFGTMRSVRVAQGNKVKNIPNLSPISKVFTPSVPENNNTPKTPSMSMKTRLFAPPDLKSIRSENINAQSVAGFRYQLNGIGTSTFTISLPASGKQLLGIALTTNNITSLADTSIVMKVNNRNIIDNAGANTFNPNYTLGLLYYPTPQELTGKDTFNVIFNKQDAGNIVVYLNVVYIPQL
jgi:hypothetical protein